MNKLNIQNRRLKGAQFIKRLPRGWTSQVTKKVQELNQTLPIHKQIPSDRASIYAVAKRLSITHPLWPFIVEVAEKERIPLKEFQEREEQLNNLLNS